jgi:hypothetical protein
MISKIILIIDKQDTIIPEKIKKSKKIKLAYVDLRPTFKKIFEIVNQNTKTNEYNIIANTDMYFDENSLKNLNNFMKPNLCLALTRWDILQDGNIKIITHDESQDTWIFKGPINYKEMDADFTQGIMACDGRIAYEIKKVGYKIYNPFKDFITYHLHKSNIRSYSFDEKDWVQGPRISVPFIYISEII